MTNENILSILDYGLKLGASDIHLSEEKYIVFRINGKLNKFNKAGLLTTEDMKYILFFLLGNKKEAIDHFYKNKDSDFAYLSPSEKPFRCNAFYQLGRVAIVMRLIISEAKNISDLKLPISVKKFTKLKQGLVLITGPTGSGKSTSMVSILDEINKERGKHIITIEDPIEFIFTEKQSTFSQREIGNDTKNFKNALKAAMREDPDIVMIGEMRDEETVSAAIELAETGHLVFSTLHTSGSVSTLTRLLSFFSSDMQKSVREKLAESLFGVLSQRLIPTADGKGRVGIYEVMMMTPGIKSLVREGNFIQINSTIETGQRNGMILMKDYADVQAKLGIIKEEDYIGYFTEE